MSNCLNFAEICFAFFQVLRDKGIHNYEFFDDKLKFVMTIMFPNVILLKFLWEDVLLRLWDWNYSKNLMVHFQCVSHNKKYLIEMAQMFSFTVQDFVTFSCWESPSVFHHIRNFRHLLHRSSCCACRAANINFRLLVSPSQLPCSYYHVIVQCTVLCIVVLFIVISLVFISVFLCYVRSRILTSSSSVSCCGSWRSLVLDCRPSATACCRSWGSHDQSAAIAFGRRCELSLRVFRQVSIGLNNFIRQ